METEAEGERGWEGGELPRGLQGPAHLMARAPSKGEDGPGAPGPGEGQEELQKHKWVGKEFGSWPRIRER